MQTRHTQESKDAFQLSEGDLRNLDKLLRAHYSEDGGPVPIFFWVDCVDGTEYTFGDVEEVLRLENSNSRRIQTVKISVSTSPRVNSIIKFASTSGTTVNVQIYDENDQRALKLRHEINNILSDAKLWYSFIPRNRLPLLMLLTIPCILTVTTFPNLPWIRHSQTLMAVTMFGSMGISILAFWKLDKVVDWFCPPVGFAWGRQVPVLENRAKWRWKLGWGFLSLLLAGLGKLVLYSD